VAVTLNGREAFSTRINLKHGEKKRIEADLPSTGQRTASWILIGTGTGAVIAGGVLGFLALQKEEQAKDIASASKEDGNQPQSDLARYDDLKQRRDDLRLAAIISASGGIAIGSLGLMLRIFDEPRAPLPPSEESVPGGNKPKQEAPASMEISAAPFVAPGAAGAFIGGRFY
jgi:hypothetical protein